MFVRKNQPFEAVVCRFPVILFFRDEVVDVPIALCYCSNSADSHSHFPEKTYKGGTTMTMVSTPTTSFMSTKMFHLKCATSIVSLSSYSLTVH